MNLEDIRNAVIQGNEMMTRTKKRLDGLRIEALEKKHSNLLAQAIFIPFYSRENLVDTTLPEIKEAMTNLQNYPGTRNKDISSLGPVYPFIAGIERKEPNGGIGSSRLRLYTDGS